MKSNLIILIDFDYTLFDTEKFVKFRSKNLQKKINYAEFLYPDSVAFVKYANSIGTTILFSEGEVEFQNEKIEGSGIKKLFSGGVRILPSFSKISALDEWHNEKVVIVDDKPEVIDKAVEKGFLTIRVRRGKHAGLKNQKPAKFAVKNLFEIVENKLLEKYPQKMSIHFAGIGGSGISAAAFLSEKMGYEVTGCDLEGNTAYRRNIAKGHSALHVKGVNLVVVSPALLYQDKTNSEVIEAKKQGKLMTWQEFLGSYLCEGKKVICIAGTHGKSTTTAMAGKLLIDAGLDPLVLVGAKVPEWGGNARFGKGEYFVIEADEFNNNFLNYHPDIAIINNIEFDHPDFFKSEEEVQESFNKFIGNLKGQKILITQKDNPGKHFNLKIFGEHNQKNANMVYLLGKKLGIPEEKIIKSIEDFSGIERRMELIADKHGIKIYDDYAHHPTAIKTTIEGLKEKFPQSRIFAVAEPHGFARTKALLDHYKDAFDGANKVIIGPIFKARDNETYGMTPFIVAERTNHFDAKGYDSFEDIKNILSNELKEGDVVLVMGAGKSYQWARQIADLI